MNTRLLMNQYAGANINQTNAVMRVEAHIIINPAMTITMGVPLGIL